MATKTGRIYQGRATVLGGYSSSSSNSMVKNDSGFSERRYPILVKNPDIAESYGFVNIKGEFVETKNIKKRVSTTNAQFLMVKRETNLEERLMVQEIVSSHLEDERKITLYLEDFRKKQEASEGKLFYKTLKVEDYRAKVEIGKKSS